jgi:hypothetical protein
MKTTKIPESIFNRIPYYFTLKEKKQILSDYITLLVRCGYDIKPLLGMPFSYFDFEKVQKELLSLIKELEEQ